MSVDPQAHRRPEIENLLAENRTFPPDPAFAAQANATAALYAEAEADYVAFWERQARERLSWSTAFTETLQWNLPDAKWFTGGELNVAYNCVDRHVERVEALGEYGIALKILGLVRATEQWAAGGELRKRLLAAFATHGIEIPRPQRVVLARDPGMDPFQPGGTSLPGPSQDDLSAGTD